MIDAPSFAELLARCAPHTPALTAIVREASGFEPFVIGTIDRKSVSIQVDTKSEAIKLASELMIGGQRVRIGLAQIDSRDLKRLGLSVTDALEPCANLTAAAKLLKEDPNALRPARAMVERSRTERGRGEEDIVPTNGRSRTDGGDGQPAWNVYGQERRRSVFVYTPKN